MLIISGFKKNSFSLPLGQSMIELVVAISVILIGVVSTLVLTLATIRGGKASEMQVIATNLAREGIEVVRQKRDNNWLGIESNVISPSHWDDGLEGASNDYTALAKFDAGSPSTWTLDYVSGSQSIDVCVNNGRCRLYFQSGIYSHNPTGEPTPYYRLIQTNQICFNDSSQVEQIFESGNCESSPQWKKIGIQVISKVKYYEKNHYELMTFEEHLYNWK